MVVLHKLLHSLVSELHILVSCILNTLEQPEVLNGVRALEQVVTNINTECIRDILVLLLVLERNEYCCRIVLAESLIVSLTQLHSLAEECAECAHCIISRDVSLLCQTTLDTALQLRDIEIEVSKLHSNANADVCTNAVRQGVHSLGVALRNLLWLTRASNHHCSTREYCQCHKYFFHNSIFKFCLVFSVRKIVQR